MINARVYPLLLFIFLVSMSGCAHSLKNKNPEVSGTSSPFTVFSGEYRNTDAIKRRPPRSIAVLPFTGDESDRILDLDSEDPREIVRTGFYNQVASLPYRDQELHLTNARLERAGFYSAEDVRETLERDPGRLAEILAVDAAIIGKVTHFDRVFAGLGSQVAVGCEVRMVDLETGDLLWRAKHVSRGFAGGVSVSPIGMVVNALASLWNLRQVQLYRETDNLFREMAATIHVPPELEQERIRPPAIAMFSALDAERVHRAGDTVRFRVVGDAGAGAVVDVEGIEETVTLRPAPEATARVLRSDILEAAKAERIAGGLPYPPEAEEELAAELARMHVYEGELTVPENFERRNATATATLISKNGGLSRSAHPGGLDFDSRPPPAPEGLEAESFDAKARLSWRPVEDDGLAGYEIFTSPGVLEGYEKHAESRSPVAMLPGLVNFSPLFVKVRAVDRAGNAGDFSRELKILPAPEPLAGPTPGALLSGEIAERVYLPAEAGPYRIEGALTVVPGGRLIIGPGAEIGFASGATLSVQGGGIAAYGQRYNPILFTPLDPDCKPGSYKGLELIRASGALLRHVRITGARVGVRIRDCSPDMTGVKVQNSAQAGLLLLDGAAPTVTNSSIVGNSGMGGLVIEGQGLAPRIQSTVFRENSAFDVQSYARVTIDLSGNYWADAGRALGDLRLEPTLESPPGAAP